MKQSLVKRLNTYQTKASILTTPLTEAELAEKEACEQSLATFIKHAWKWVEGGRPYIHNWTTEVIALTLTLMFERKLRNVVINIPPRMGKSTICGVLFPAWAWIKNPNEQFFCASFSHSLSLRDSLRCRRLIESPWYRRLWGDKFSLVGDQNTKSRYDNTARGYRIASSVGGSITGEGSDTMIVDDGNNMNEVYSDIIREGVNEWWDQVMPMRVNNFKTACRLVIQQRGHVRDLTGHILSKDDAGDWFKLILPMEYEKNHEIKCDKIPGYGKADLRNKEGELLWPERIDATELRKIKANMNSEATIAGQLQQRPSPATGGLIKKAWYKLWKQPETPECHYIIQSWDTALSTEVTACYSACSTWGVFNWEGASNLILLNLWRGQVGMPELRRMAQRLYFNYLDDGEGDPLDWTMQPDEVLIEAKANGLSLLQELSRAGVTVTKFNPTPYGGKIARAHKASPLIEGGRVWLPAKPPHYVNLRNYAEVLLEASAKFPSGESSSGYDDIVDTMTQVIIKLKNSGFLSHPTDPESEPSFKKKITLA